MNSIRKSMFKTIGEIHSGPRIRKMHIFRAINKTPSFKAVLDAGCGGGDYIFYLAQRYPDSTFDGFEIDPIHYQECQIKKQKLKLDNVNILLGDLTKPIYQNKYDLIYSIDVLEHIKNDIIALQNMYDALGTGGKLILHVPLIEEHIFKKIKSMPKQDDHVREGYDIEDIIYKLNNIGFKINKKQYTFSKYKGALAWELNRMYPYITYPLVIVLCYLDVFTPNKSGGGILIIAEKR
ncbi:MAG: class I SAM-dependent methyltransferase [Candidatus Methanoperedens sp.]|nr:class I SAM-dependent methyltransferase [Candidatus Methanoperedens sp.]